MNMVDEGFVRTGVPFPLLIMSEEGERRGRRRNSKMRERERSPYHHYTVTHKLTEFGYFMWSAPPKDNASPTEVCVSESVIE